MKKPKLQHWQLQQRINMPYRFKPTMSMTRIERYIEYWDGNVYVAFSGGWDSTILLDLVRRVDPTVPAVFVNTGLEFRDIVDFVKTIDNVVWLKPKMSFNKVVEKYGWPVIGKTQSMAISRCRNTKSEEQRQYRMWGAPGKKAGVISQKWHYMLDAPFKISDRCCDVMKKDPFHKYDKETGRVPFTGERVDESEERRRVYMSRGCNMYEGNHPKSTPMSFWTKADTHKYMMERNLSYCRVYDDRIIDGVAIKGERSTGCVRCLFGLQYDDYIHRIERLKVIDPIQYQAAIRMGIEEPIEWILKGARKRLQIGLFGDITNEL